jgi:hypothetical protein
MSKFIQAETKRLKKRIDVLQKHVDEHAQLRAILAAFETTTTPGATTTGTIGRPAHRQHQIIATLADAPFPLTGAEISRKLGISYSQSYSTLNAMIRKGTIAKNNDKTYSVIA